MNGPLPSDPVRADPSRAEAPAAGARRERPRIRSTRFKGKVLVEVREGNDVVWSLRAAATTLAERAPAGSRPAATPAPRDIRESLGQTQEGFAQILGVSVETVRSWEQGKRRPQGPARTLLSVTAQDPLALLKASGMLLEAA